MANCSCTGSTGSTYATVNRGYGCLSSVPSASSIPYNCFLPPTNMSYYQNYPFYNGPCGTVAGSSSGSGSSGGGTTSNCCCCCCPTSGGTSSAPTQPSAPAAPNCCCCCCPTSGGSQSVPTTPVQPSLPAAPNCCCCCCPAPSDPSGSQSSVPSTPLLPAIPTGKCCFPWGFPWCCCPTTSEDEEEEEDEDMSSTNCCYPWFCNPCCGAPQSVPSTPLMPPVCKPCCKPNVCCQPAALIATSNGAFQPAVNGLVPLTLVNTLSSALSLMSDTITINCPGTYLVTLSSNIPTSSTYTGNASVALNGSPIATTTQSFTTGTASQNTTQAIVKATKGSTLTITTSAAGTAQITPTGGTNLFTISVVRIA